MFDSNHLLRYSRQIILKEVGNKGQEKLSNARVLVAGAGGLGSPVSYYLAGAGIGTLGIADFDTVSVSNLQRQILYSNDDIGKRKTDIAQDRLKKLNPEVNVIKHPLRLNADNIEEIVCNYDIVIDATDNIATRYLVSDCCHFLKKPLIEGAVTGFDGLLMTIIPDRSPCYRCLYPAPPKDGILPSCANLGIIGAAAGMLGSLQAMEAIKLVLDTGHTLSGRVLFFDGLNMQFNEIQLDKNPECPLCGSNPTIKDLELYEVKCHF